MADRLTFAEMRASIAAQLARMDAAATAAADAARSALVPPAPQPAEPPAPQPAEPPAPPPVGGIVIVHANQEPAVASTSRYVLNAFWPERPDLWFIQAEGMFAQHGELADMPRYFKVLASLQPATLPLVADIIERPPAAGAYLALKKRLMAGTKLSDFQKAERLSAMPALGDRRPSDMMAVMLEACPRGWETENFFRFMFMSRLPTDLRVHMRDVEGLDLHALADMADELHSHCSALKKSAVVAAVPVAMATVAAVAPFNPPVSNSNPKKVRQGYGGRGRGGQQQSGGRGGQQSSRPERPSWTDGLCSAHKKFGPRTYAANCVAPCSWSQEN